MQTSTTTSTLTSTTIPPADHATPPLASSSSKPKPPSTSTKTKSQPESKFKYVPSSKPQAKQHNQKPYVHNKNNKKPMTTNEKYEKEDMGGKGKNRFKKQPPPAEATCILPYLYLGSSMNAADGVLAKGLGLGCVLNVAEELVDIVIHEGVNHVRLIVEDAVPDGHDQFALFEQAFVHIDEAKANNKAILVHCMRGRSRSATIVLGYLMTRYKMTLKEAHTHVKRLRPFIGPHRRLKKQLFQFERHLYGTNTVGYEEGYGDL